MHRYRRSWPDALAACASACLLLSLWLHWYSFRIPGYLIDQAESLAPRLGALGPLLSRESELARTVGTLHLDAWRAFGTIDVVLAVLGTFVVAMALLGLAGRATGTGWPIALCGGLALILAGFRTVSAPGPAGLLHPSVGAYLAIVCSLALVAAGAFGAAEPEVARTAAGGGWDVPLRPRPAWPPPPSSAPTSVPPPGNGDDGVLSSR